MNFDDLFRGVQKLIDFGGGPDHDTDQGVS